MSKLVLAMGIALALLFAACETEPATDVSHFTAKLNGKGSCQGTYDVEWWYQYGTVGFTEWADAPHHDFHCNGVSATFTIPPEQISGLFDGVTYRFRLAAKVNGDVHYYDANGTTDGTSYDTFATLPFPRVTPKAAQAFRNTQGVNSRIPFHGPWENVPAIKDAGAWMGIKFLRETWRVAYRSTFHDLALSGFTFSFGLGRMDVDNNGTCGPFEIDSLLAEMRFDPVVWNAIKYIESPNEITGSDGEHGLGDQWDECTRTFLAAQQDALNGEKPIIGPTVSAPGGNPNVADANRLILGNIEQYVDFGNMHPYAGGLAPDTTDLEADGTPFNAIDYNRPRAQILTPNRPIFATEAGYHTNLNNTNVNAPTPEAVQASYMVRLFLEYFRRGVPHTDIYAIVDNECSTATDYYAYGLYRCDWTKKPVVDAIHNLNITVGTGTPTLTPLAMRVDSGPSDLLQVVTRRSDGAYVVALWRRAKLWDREPPRHELTVAPQNVTLTLPYANSVGRVTPNQSATETGLTLNASKQVTVPVAGEAVLLVVR